jgi:hypothetical protein
MEPVEFGNGNGTTPVGESSSAEPEESYSLASPFLNGMPEEHRTLLSPYVKQWDGQVTKKFQDYSSKLKPYEALGPVDELQKYYNFAQNFRNDPEGLFRLMWKGLEEQYGDNFQTEIARILEIQQEQEMSDETEYEYEEESAPVDDQFQQNVLKELNELREWRSNFEKAQEDQIGQQQLDGLIDQMHTAYGDFNDDFIVMELSKHGDVQQAMQAWNSLIGKYSSQQAPQRQAPKIMGGQGGVPSGQVDTDKLRGADRKAAVANMLAQLEGN